MKRYNNLYEKIYNIDNIILADKIARKHKTKHKSIVEFDKNKEENINNIHEMLKNKTFKTSKYTTFKIFEPKERLIYKLPYYPDRIVHHAIMNILVPILFNLKI